MDVDVRRRRAVAAVAVAIALAPITAGARSTVPTRADDEAPLAAAAAAAAPEPSWSGGVAELARKRCVSCHVDRGAAPFPLTSPADFAGAAAMIRAVVTDGQMPPWYATPASGPFRNDARLTSAERELLCRWLDAGCPPGANADPIAPEIDPRGWRIGEPDLVVTVATPVKIPPTGVVDYLIREAGTKLTESVWVDAMQIRCEHPEICHHVLAHAIYRDEKSSEFVDSYLPGGGPTILPKGVAFKLDAGAVIRFQLHYTPNGTAVAERTQIGFRFAKEPPTLRLASQIVRGKKPILIPPGEADYVVEAEYRFPDDAQVWRLMPHMHLRGKSSRIEVEARDGTRSVPLELERWNPDWQISYEFVTPLAVERRTVLRCTSRFDNSRANPFNPDPSATVKSGAQIWNEMDGVFVQLFMPADRPYERGVDFLQAVRERGRSGLPGGGDVRKRRAAAEAGGAEEGDDPGADESDGGDDDGGD